MLTLDQWLNWRPTKSIKFKVEWDNILLVRKTSLVSGWYSGEITFQKHKVDTVDSRYLKLGYLESCETRSVYLNQKYILIAFFNNNLALDTFYKSKLPEVQINLHFG